MDKALYRENLEYFRDVRALDQMTPRERAHALSRGESVDRMPVYTFSDLLIPRLLGYTIPESEESAKHKAEVQVAGYRLFGHDGVGFGYGLYSLPIFFGGSFVEPDDTSRTLTEPPIGGSDDFSILDLDRVGLERDPVARRCFDAIRYVQDEIGDEVECGMNFTAPFTVASGFVGVERFCRMLVRDVESARHLLDFTLEAQFKLAEPFLKEGISISTSDPVAVPEIIGPELYRSFALPYEAAFAHRCMAYMGNALTLHICGDTTRILHDLSASCFGTFSLDNRVDLSEAKARLGATTTIVGNVDPVGIMLSASPDEVMAEVRACFRKAADAPCGFRISHGCDIPYHTPRCNQRAYLLESKLCAAEQANEPSGTFRWE